MIRVIIDVDAPGYRCYAIKEWAAALLERWGDTQVIDVVPIAKGSPYDSRTWMRALQARWEMETARP